MSSSAEMDSSTESAKIQPTQASFPSVLTKYRRAQTLKIVAFALIAIFALLYVLVAVVVPNRQFFGGSDATCEIVRAERFCWRRSILSLAWVEQGSYTCWLLLVKSEQITSIPTQAGRWKSLRKLYHRCDNFDDCGRIELPCRFNANRSAVVLRWRFPVVSLAIGLTILVLGSCGALWFTWQLFKYRPVCLEESTRLPDAAPLELNEVWVDASAESR